MAENVDPALCWCHHTPELVGADSLRGAAIESWPLYGLGVESARTTEWPVEGKGRGQRDKRGSEVRRQGNELGFLR